MKKKITLEEQKEIMLKMMDYIDLFCRENKITYYLYGGSLIGAIRHKGYIPWDDDIDICMLRKDYDRFLSIFRDSNNRYKLISLDNNSDYYLPTAKVYDANTVLKEKVSGGIPIGIFIDVFPLDECFDNFDEAQTYGSKIGRYRRILRIKNIAFSKKRTTTKNAALFCLKVLTVPFNKRWLIKKIMAMSTKYKGNSSKYVGQFTQMTYESKEIYERHWFDTAIPASFEGRKYFIPKEYDRVLRTEYGDYMKLPPKEKQVTHHVNEAWWKNNYR